MFEGCVVIVQRMTDWVNGGYRMPNLADLRRGKLLHDTALSTDSAYNRAVLANDYTAIVPFYVYRHSDIVERKSKASPLYEVTREDSAVVEAWAKEDRRPLDEFVSNGSQL